MTTRRIPPMQRLNCSLKELKFAPGGTEAEQMTSEDVIATILSKVPVP